MLMECKNKQIVQFRFKKLGKRRKMFKMTILARPAYSYDVAMATSNIMDIWLTYQNFCKEWMNSF